MLSQWGAMGRQDLTLMPLAKVTAFSSGLSNPLQVILHTHTHKHAYTSLWSLGKFLLVPFNGTKV